MSGVLKDTNGEISVNIALLPDSSLEVSPIDFQGYSIVFKEDKMSTSYGSLEFYSAPSLSRFESIYRMFCDMKTGDFTARGESVENGCYTVTEKETKLYFSKDTLLPERLERGNSVFIFKDLT